ncbi:hypothetical protein BDZ97DRAFT_1927528 [Flammula alnicola]|nr:hypothetical protein BDZ97DRAFT_1927528 [Flammula alnicola]
MVQWRCHVNHTSASDLPHDSRAPTTNGGCAAGGNEDRTPVARPPWRIEDNDHGRDNHAGPHHHPLPLCLPPVPVNVGVNAAYHRPSPQPRDNHKRRDDRALRDRPAGDDAAGTKPAASYEQPRNATSTTDAGDTTIPLPLLPPGPVDLGVDNTSPAPLTTNPRQPRRPHDSHDEPR